MTLADLTMRIWKLSRSQREKMSQRRKKIRSTKRKMEDSAKDKAKNVVRRNKVAKMGRKERLTKEDYSTFEEKYNMNVVFYSKEEQIKEVEMRKESPNYLNAKFSCDFCYKGFITEKAYSNHMVVHDMSSGEYECDVCRARFPSRKQLYRHHGPHKQKFFCRGCDFSTSRTSHAINHFKFHKGLKYKCKYCGKISSSVTAHLSHIRLVHKSKMDVCVICGERFIGERGLSAHIKKTHKDASKSFCKSCSTQFHDPSSYETHLLYCGTHCCPLCGAGFQNNEELESHTLEHGERFGCTQCDLLFNTEPLLVAHYNRAHLHPKPKPRPSTHVKKPRAAGACVKRRSTCEKDDKPQSFMCEMCGKGYSNPWYLKYHQRRHTGEKPFQCNMCPKGFRLKELLKNHLRIHTGERPYKCSLCPKAFKSRSANIRHQKVHTGARPYACPQCGRGFSQSNSMKLHVNTVHLHMPAPYKSKARRGREMQAKKGDA